MVQSIRVHSANKLKTTKTNVELFNLSSLKLSEASYKKLKRPSTGFFCPRNPLKVNFFFDFSILLQIVLTSRPTSQHT